MDDKSRIQSFAKMMAVLEAFSPVRRRLTLAQVALHAGLPRSTTHRMLTALRELGLIEQDARTGLYALGVRLYQLGSLALSNMDLLREAKPFMDRLTRLTGESSHLGVFNGHQVVVVERDDPGDKPKPGVDFSEAAPAHCTGVGKAVLAFQPEAALRRVVEAGLQAFTSKTIVDPRRLAKEMSAIRARGYAFDDAEHQVWVRCVAAPIRNGSGDVFAALSVTGAADRITLERAEQLAPLVVQTADSISRQLGYEQA